MTSTSETIKTLGPVGAVLVQKLARTGRPIFTTEEARKALGLSSHATVERLRLLLQRGWLTRLNRGLYMLLPIEAGPASTWSEDPAIIASRLVTPSYLSFWSALHFHGLTEQPPGVVTVATCRSHPSLELLGLRYLFVSLSPRKFFGHLPTWIGTVKVPIASPEKAILDSLDHPEYAGGISEVAKALVALGPRLQPRRLLYCLRRMQQGAVAKRLGYLLELFDLAPHLQPTIRTLLKAGYPLLDPTMGPGGRCISRWQLRVNIPETQLLAGIGT